MPTKIEWATESWNPVTGCTKVSEGCQNCYAERMAKRFTKHFNVTCHPDRLNQPLHWRKPRRIFVCSMGDLFHEDVPDNFISEVFDVMGRQATQHQYIVLTKRSDRMKNWTNQTFGENDPYPNIIGMVTAEDQKRADERILDLLQSRFAIRGVSIEPMLGAVDIMPYISRPCKLCNGSMGVPVDGGSKPCPRCIEDQAIDPDKLDWVIIGAESGPKRRECKIEDVRNVVQQCAAAGIPVFVKQLSIDVSHRTPLYGTKLSKNMAEWPEDLRIQEFPHD